MNKLNYVIHMKLRMIAKDLITVKMLHHKIFFHNYIIKIIIYIFIIYHFNIIIMKECFTIKYFQYNYYLIIII